MMSALALGASRPTGDHDASDRAAVAAAFAAWATGRGSVYDLLTDDATVTIAGTGPHTGRFTKGGFQREVARPFMARFSTPIVPRVRKIWAEGGEVVVLWDGRATDCDGRPYTNTYAFFFTMRGGRATAVTEFLDLRAFQDVWDRCDPARPRRPAAGHP